MTYGNPPQSGQFQKGKSGNPKGRPPKKKQKSVSLSEDLLWELQETVKVNKNGEVVLVTKQQALVISMMTKAINGSIGQQRLLVELLNLAYNAGETDVPSSKELEKNDEALRLELKQLGLSFDGSNDDP
jgi:hypothetical protein